MQTARGMLSKAFLGPCTLLWRRAWFLLYCSPGARPSLPEALGLLRLLVGTARKFIRPLTSRLHHWMAWLYPAALQIFHLRAAIPSSSSCLKWKSCDLAKLVSRCPSSFVCTWRNTSHLCSQCRFLKDHLDPFNTGFPWTRFHDHAYVYLPKTWLGGYMNDR